MGTSAREIQQVLELLPIPDPWDRNQFVENVAELRGRPITVLPLRILGSIESPCGLWLVRKHDDVIIHEDATSEYHVDQIVCHEIGHMVLGHDRTYQGGVDTPEADQLFRLAFPDIDPSTVQAVLGRSAYESGPEREAEMFASMVMVSSVSTKRDQNFRNVLFKRR
ncbi:hypothetical protein [Nocardia amamiensis]|uniref:hypothetical protein n=1 Tax=Nocardia amamiensis TaxID=404578 RepID=UPI001E2BB9AF|nr:hypothetical protein [Nocardia amamiensis]